eukprot:g79717.t1
MRIHRVLNVWIGRKDAFDKHSESSQADDDVPAPALAEKQKSTNDQQTTASTRIFQGKMNTVFARIYPSTSITTRKRHANPTACW